MDNLPLCEFFESFNSGGMATSDCHPAEPGLHFFVPVGEDAVRVSVCERHAEHLSGLYQDSEYNTDDIPTLISDEALEEIARMPYAFSLNVPLGWAKMIAAELIQRRRDDVAQHGVSENSTSAGA